MQQGVQMDATCNIQQCWELLAQNVTSLCTGFQADSANSSKRWTLLKASAYRLRRGTNTGRIRIQSVFDKTSVRIRISYTQTWKENEHHGLLSPLWLSPPQRSLCVSPLLFYDYCYFIGVPSWSLYGGERHSCTEFIFSEKHYFT